MISFKEFLNERASTSIKVESPNIGDYYEGGYYIGNSDGYRIIVSPKKFEKQLNHYAALAYPKKMDDDGFEDWFLPSLPELNLLHLYRDNLPSSESMDYVYWSNSEVNEDLAYMMSINSGHQGQSKKLMDFYVRLIRKEKI